VRWPFCQAALLEDFEHEIQKLASPPKCPPKPVKMQRRMRTRMGFYHRSKHANTNSYLDLTTCIYFKHYLDAESKTEETESL
jgi:hypothetical protein